MNEDLAQAALDTINALNARVKMLEAKLAEAEAALTKFRGAVPGGSWLGGREELREL